MLTTYTHKIKTKVMEELEIVIAKVKSLSNLLNIQTTWNTEL